MRVFGGPGELPAAAGERLGVSGYHELTQWHLDRFAEVSGDHQWIHTDPQRARSGPFGGLIAHGMLTLSLLMPMLDEIFRVEGCDLVVNKGMDRLRFLSPVPVGAKIRADAELAAATTRPRGFTEAVIAVSVEIDGHRSHAYTAEQRLLFHAFTD